MSATTAHHTWSFPHLNVGMPRILAVWLHRVQDRARDRDALGFMTDRDLMDMGVSRYDVLNEIQKPFWRG